MKFAMEIEKLPMVITGNTNKCLVSLKGELKFYKLIAAERYRHRVPNMPL